MSTRTPLLLVGLLMALILAALPPGHASGNAQNDGLERRVRELESIVSSLDARVDALERALQPGGATPAKEVWRRLLHGMTTDEVRRVLGPPSSTDRNPVVTYWFYSPKGKLGPHVLFDSTHMTVNGWTEPR